MKQLIITQEQLDDILCLVLDEVPDTTKLNDVQKQQLFNWATAEHFYASDNQVKRLPKPDFI